MGNVWSAQFCTEVARPKRFELLTFAFGGAVEPRRDYGLGSTHAGVRTRLGAWMGSDFAVAQSMKVGAAPPPLSAASGRVRFA